jgi:hypothetical protein
LEVKVPLPFLKHKRDEGGIAGTIMKNRTPDEKPQEDQDDGSEKLSLAKDILNAIQMNSPDALADAMEAMFKHLDKEPHAEGKHIEPHSYDASKQND